MSLELTEFVKRPGVGTAGKPVRVRSNFFEVTSFPTQNIHHYDVTIDPASMPPAVLRKVWKSFEDTDGQGVLKGIKCIYDGRKNVFSPKPLPLGDENAMAFDVTLQEGPANAASKRAGNQFKIRIKKAGEVNMEELRRFLNGQSACTSNCLTAIMVLDVLIRHMPSMKHATVGRSFYTPADSRPLPNGAEVWQGFYQSARPTAGKMMINIDVSATAFYESGPLPEIVVKVLGRRSMDDLRRGISDRDRQKLEKALKGLKIQVVHRGEVKRQYKINKLTPSTPDRTNFKDESGAEMTVAAYFQKQYGMRLSCPFLPCVVVKKDIFLPMEVCVIVKGQRYMKKLNEKQTAEMIKFTCQKPNVRANKINNGLQLLEYRNNPYLQQFGMSVKPEMAMVNARVLQTPKISYHPSSQEATFAPMAGAWNLRGKKVAQGAVLGSWSVVNFAGPIPPPVIQRFVRELCQTFIDTGLNVLNRQPPITNADPQGNIDRTLKEAWLKAGNAAKANPQLILCILPNTGVPLYAEIKRVSDTVLGVSTQCVQSKHINDAKKQYCANVCLKVNMKLGGMNLFLAPPMIPFISSRPTILFGADVTHPAPGETNRPSIAAVTASMDARASRYASAIRVQANRTEIVADLANMVKELLKNFYQSCGQKPERILFYRDGVSEGQFQAVKDNEIAAIRAACASLDKNYKPPITFVVVQKRHHARFFPVEQRDADRTGNCMPGTVVDTGIVHPFEFDFYLQSHAGLQGTSRPTHYHVLRDENGFTADALQELTYRLCYIYGRATRAVSIVPPAYYADLVAARARFHRRGENWSDTDATSESMDSEAQMASFAVVKPELQKVMYFM
ncbi:Piwi domain-containing protein [Radiomyces spectabilis]|uniref:Piwi domain-containing protein n=1 Tax=Radiomyces spectabilis TaxID=64574 RepID=UPI0022202586|nr:Piwi domain-containing protein [Radiomyces spectabilis]KAI8371592.1 Piwi domain-containing protein [Radiomyces spectabilis]